MRAIFSTFYDDVAEGDVVFDTNRLWCSKLALIIGLFPHARVICCVRDMPWVFELDRAADPQEQVSAVGHLQFRVRRHGLFACRGPRRARRHGRLCLERAARSLLRRAERPAALVTYETLTTHAATRARGHLRLHRRGAVSARLRQCRFRCRRIRPPARHARPAQGRAPRRGAASRPVLPADLVRKYEKDSFWRDPANNPNKVRVI